MYSLDELTELIKTDKKSLTLFIKTPLLQPNGVNC